MNVIDIHGHYAYGIDDGAQNEEETRALFERAKKNHVTHVALTPHIKPGKLEDNFYDLYKQSFLETKKIAREYDIHAVIGSEVLINDLTYEYISQKKFFTLNNTQYVLVEFPLTKPYDENADEFESALYEIKIGGYIPVIAHTERYFKDIDVDVIEQWIKWGYVIQVNIQSFFQEKASSEYKNAMALLNHGLIHVLASDSHDDKTKRRPSFNKCIKLLLELIDTKDIQILLQDNPARILKGLPVQNMKKTVGSSKWTILDKLKHK